MLRHSPVGPGGYYSCLLFLLCKYVLVVYMVSGPGFIRWCAESHRKVLLPHQHHISIKTLDTILWPPPRGSSSCFCHSSNYVKQVCSGAYFYKGNGHTVKECSGRCYMKGEGLWAIPLSLGCILLLSLWYFKLMFKLHCLTYYLCLILYDYASF